MQETRLKNEADEDLSALALDDLESVNLNQALVDFEIANARVMDLTGRVTSMSSELLQLRSQIGQAKLAVSMAEAAAAVAEADAASARHEVAVIRGSLAYRVLRRLGDVRASLRRGR